jgi:hypothetical protein
MKIFRGNGGQLLKLPVELQESRVFFKGIFVKFFGFLMLRRRNQVL